MKFKILSLICLMLLLSAVSLNAGTSDQTNFQTFWKDFKAAVEKGDKNALAGMTKFPLNMQYGVKSVKTKAEFIKRYKEIFYGEADGAKCFPKAELQKDDAKNYSVYCGFKNSADKEDTPIKYYFELTKTGWKFAGLDNINE